MVVLPEHRLLCFCDGCALLMSCIASRAHAVRSSFGLMSSGLKGHDVFVHGSSPFADSSHETMSIFIPTRSLKRR